MARQLKRYGYGRNMMIATSFEYCLRYPGLLRGIVATLALRAREQTLELERATSRNTLSRPRYCRRLVDEAYPVLVLVSTSAD